MDLDTFNRNFTRFERICDARTRQRGKSYFESGAVSKLRIEPGSISGQVRGHYSNAYVTRLQIWGDGNGFDANCSCPVGFECKHAYALALAARERIQNGNERGESQLSAKSATIKAASIASIEKELAKRHGKSLGPKLKKYPKKLFQIWNIFQSRGQLFEQDLLKLGASGSLRFHYYRALDELKEMWESAPASPIELLDCLALYDVIYEIGLPEELTDLAEIDRPRRIYSRRLREREIKLWKENFQQAARTLGSSAAETSAGPFDLALELGHSQWRLMLIDPQGRQEPLSRKKREQLKLSDPDYGLPGLTPHAAQFFTPFMAHFALENRSHLDPRSENARRLLNRLIRLPAAQGRVRNAQGDPVTLAAEPLVYQIERQVQGEDVNALVSLRLPDGSPLPADAIRLPSADRFRIPEAVLADHTIFDAPPPLDPRNSEWKADTELPWECIESAEGLAFLKASGSQLPDDLAASVLEVALKPLLEIKTAGEESGLALNLELKALDPAGNPVSAFQAQEWSDATFAAPSGKIPQLDWTQPREAVAHFLSFEPNWNGYRRIWNLQLAKTAIDELSEWLRGFPTHTSIKLPAHLKSLLEAPSRLQYDFTVEPDSAHRDWFNISAVLKAEDTELTPAELKLLLRAKGRFVFIKGKGWKRLDFTVEDDSLATLAKLGIEPGASQPQRYHALQLAELARSSESDEPSEWQRALQGIAEPQPLALPDPPAELAPMLRPYQTEGFQFLSHLALRQFGGLLADDMGLGKTVQTLAWLMWLRKEKGGDSFRTLVICPKSVTDNWIHEAEKFATGLQAKTFVKGASKTALASANLLVANYTQLRLNAPYFTSQDWDVAILDEGQYIKNPASQTAKVACSLRAARRLVLSGTPVENRLLDLWSLMRFAMPGLLGSQASFTRLYNDKTNPHAAANIARRVKPFLLRRSKSQVAQDLPPRIEEEIHCALEGEQAKLYQAELKKAQQSLLKVKSEKQFDQQRFNILQSLLRMRQICCDPRLVGLDTKAKFVSAKTDALLDLLEPILAEGSKVLVFSQFVSQLELLQATLKEKEIPTLILTGKTENRQDLVARFQKPDTEQVFLLSLKAAGSGLNLTAASYVVLYDPWWNPAVEAQAVDRTHRIGQQSRVIAYRLIAKDTIEEKIRSLQKEKAQIAESVVQEESLASVLDLESLRHLLA